MNEREYRAGPDSRRWSAMFWAAVGFNGVIGLPVWFAPDWTFALCFHEAPTPGAVRHWGDFGFGVVLIGVGYAMVAADVARNRGIVWLGVFAKVFDVVVLSARTGSGAMKPLVLIPGAIDAAFVLLFVWFLCASSGRRFTTRQPAD
ncbi:MAG: hypothetical protein IPK26_09135 [Planctomycetes bacterium]|nr:hypothetical protein [Planctomycetota bacterium]